MAAVNRYCSATVRLFSKAKALWASRFGAIDASARVAITSVLFNKINDFRPEFREGRMQVILGLRCRVR